jgi:hypothetical protein
MVVVSMMLALVVVLVVMFLSRETHVVTEQASAAPTTVSPKMSPTAAPTMIIDDLPDFSLEALAEPLSPPSKAHAWLASYPYFADMEQEAALCACNIFLLL